MKQHYELNSMKFSGGLPLKMNLIHVINSFTMYLLPDEFSPLTWPARSLTTVADVAILTLFNFILPALGEWLECDIWCH